MLYEIATIIVTLICLLCSVCALYVAFRILGAVQGTVQKPKKVTISQKKNIIRANKKVDEERQKLETLLANLERYDGTGFGQKEIE